MTMAWASERPGIWLWIGTLGGSSLRAFAALAGDRFREADHRRNPCTVRGCEDWEDAPSKDLRIR